METFEREAKGLRSSGLVFAEENIETMRRGEGEKAKMDHRIVDVRSSEEEDNKKEKIENIRGGEDPGIFHHTVIRTSSISGRQSGRQTTDGRSGCLTASGRTEQSSTIRTHLEIRQ